MFVPNRDYAQLSEAVCPRQQRFLMKITYPGLLVGTGYMHEAEKGSDECIKLGFSFDYVNGQPYVPGSSVKGMLRSCFDRPEVIGEVIREVLSPEEIPGRDALLKLRDDIFETGKDIFFDAMVRRGDGEGRPAALWLKKRAKALNGKESLCSFILRWRAIASACRSTIAS